MILEHIEELINNDKIIEAIPLLEKEVKNGNFNCAFRLALLYIDCYEDMGYKKPQYKKAIKFLKISAKNGDLEAQFELGLILMNDKYSLLNRQTGVELILKSKKNIDMKQCKKILDIFTEMKNNLTYKNFDDCHKMIELFEHFGSITTNQFLKGNLKMLVEQMTVKAYNNYLAKCDNLNDLEKMKENYLFYKEKSFFGDTFFEFVKKYIKLNLNNITSKKCADNLLLNIKKMIKNIDYMKNETDIIFDDIYLWFADAYRLGKFRMKKDLKKAMEYCMKVSSKKSNRIRKRIMEDSLKSEINRTAKSDEAVVLKANIDIEGCFDCLSSLPDIKEEKKVIEKVNISWTEDSYNAIDYVEDSNDLITKSNSIFKHNNNMKNNLNNFSKELKSIKEIYNLAIKNENIDQKKALKLYRVFLSSVDKLDNKDSFEIERRKAFIFILSYYKKHAPSKVEDVIEYGKEENIIYYDTKSYEFMNIEEIFGNLNSTGKESNKVYWIEKYYQKWWLGYYEEPLKNIKVENSYNEFMQIKHYMKKDEGTLVDYIDDKLKIADKLKWLFDKLYAKWVICFVPSHKKTNKHNIDTGVTYLVEKEIGNNKNIYLYKDLILRIYTVPTKHYSTNRSNDYKNDMKSMEINSRFNIENKNIVVFDDITTTKSSLIACRNLLLNAGAKRVICVALGRTVGKGESYEF